MKNKEKQREKGGREGGKKKKKRQGNPLMRNALVTTFARLRKDEKGVTLVEYGIAILVAVVVGTAGLLIMGNQINANMTAAAEEAGARE